MSRSSASEHVVIAGAGPVGSLAALTFARRGYRVDVYERRDDMRRTGAAQGRSINLALSDRGWRALDAVGVGDEIRARAIPMHGRMMHATDGTLTHQPYGASGQYINAVHRAELNRALLTLAETSDAVTLHFEHRCLGVDDFGEAGPVSVRFRSPDDDERSVTADALVGADGAFSAVRQSLMMSTERFDYSQQWLSHGYKELHFAARPGEGDERFAMEKHALHIWPRGDFMLIALPNLDGSFTGTLFFPYESDRGPSFESVRTDDDVRRLFDTHFADAVEHLPTLVEDWHDNPTSALGTIRCWPWGKGRTTLVGDASHPIVPFYGQGLVSGMEDCFVLGEHLDAAASLDEAFARFGQSRKPNADAIGELALQNFVEMRDRVADERFLLQKRIEARIAELFEGAYLPQYSMVTFSTMPYASALARGREQDAWLAPVLDWPDVEARLGQPDLDDELRAYIGQKLQARNARP